jgi:hypothetical protein
MQIIRYSCKILMKDFLVKFSKVTQISSFVFSGTDLFHAGGRADGWAGERADPTN